MDVAGYLLTRLGALGGGASPASLDRDEVKRWIRRNELKWAPGCADLGEEVPWANLEAMPDDLTLVGHVLGEAATEVEEGMSRDGVDDVVPFAARRFLSQTTLAAVGCPVQDGALTERDCADGHVHRGAALPIEVTLHWIAARVSTIARSSESLPELKLSDTDEVGFDVLPLLLFLHLLVTNDPVLADGALTDLVVASARSDADAWDRLNSKLGSEEDSEPSVPTISGLIELKKEALSGWQPWRRVALLRAEAILYGALTQRESGLDAFIEQFQKLSVLPWRGLSEESYFEQSIRSQIVSSRRRLRSLELRLGASVSNVSPDRRSVEVAYADALRGYRKQIGSATDDPIRVTFPWALVKSLPGHSPEAENWRYNPAGIYAQIELLIEVLASHEHLPCFIDGIDVCGHEESEPNWLFAAAFERFAGAMAGLDPLPTLRFHAGEWHWSPVHGLRRIAEFLRFRAPARVPRRIGHGLALFSQQWDRLAQQPADELFDDLVWARERFETIDEVPAAMVRSVDRTILDLRDAVCPEETRDEPVSALVEGYAACFDTDALLAVSFLTRDGQRLEFRDLPPATPESRRLRMLVSRLRKGPAIAKLEDVFDAAGLDALRSMLLDLYDLLAGEVAEDVRWQGAVVEVCPTSNLFAGAVRGHLNHPMRKFVEHGVLTTVNSDDPALFRSWVPDELEHAEKRMRVPKRQVRSSRELGVRLVAPGLEESETIGDRLDRAIEELV